MSTPLQNENPKLQSMSHPANLRAVRCHRRVQPSYPRISSIAWIPHRNRSIRGSPSTSSCGIRRIVTGNPSNRAACILGRLVSKGQCRKIRTECCYELVGSFEATAKETGKSRSRMAISASSEATSSPAPARQQMLHGITTHETSHDATQHHTCPSWLSKIADEMAPRSSCT